MGGSFAPGLALQAIGYRPSTRDIDAMMHFWRYVGHLMGVRPRWYPETLRDAAQLTFVTLVKGARLSGDDGRELCQSYARAFAPETGLPWRERLAAALEHRLHLAYTQLFVSSRSHRAYGLPAAGRLGARAARRRPRSPPPPSSPAARCPGSIALLDRAARRRRARWFARHMGERTAEYKPVEQFTR